MDFCEITWIFVINLEARQMAGQMIERPIAWILSPRTTIMEALRQGYGVGAERFEELIDGRLASTENDALRQEITVLEDNEDATVMSFVNQISERNLLFAGGVIGGAGNGERGGLVTNWIRGGTATAGEGRKRSKPIERETRGRHGGRTSKWL